MSDRLPAVTIVVPLRNEAENIRGCVRSIAAQNYSADRVEVVFVDGASTDDTPRILKSEAASLLSRWSMLVNSSGDRSSSLNMGLAAATGEILVRVDARSRPAPGYLKGCVEILEERPGVGVVGGAQLALPGSDRVVERGVCRALQNRWAMGLSRYRLARRSGPSDTVWMGAFRIRELRTLGGWNIDVGINEDYELNERYRRTGATVWFDAALRTGYVPRTGLAALSRQYLSYGRAKGIRWRAGAQWRPRHVLLVAAPPVAAVLATASARRLGPIRAGLLLAAALGLLEASGGSEVEADPRVRCVSLAAMATICGSWWSGVLLGLLEGRRAAPASRHR